MEEEEEEFFNSLMLCSTMEVGFLFFFCYWDIEIEEIVMMGFEFENQVGII